MTKQKGKNKAKARRKKSQQKVSSYQAYKKKTANAILKHDSLGLYSKCEPVVDVKEPHIAVIIKKMKQVLGCTKNGVGLAAPQIAHLDNIIIVRRDSNDYNMIVMINPEITWHSEEKKYGIEGCLSYPGIYAPVERFVSIKVKYLDEHGYEHTKHYKEKEFLGIIIQHEIEHLEEGFCQIYEWWKDPEDKKRELQEIFDAKNGKVSEDEAQEGTGGCEVVESEDFKREREESEASAKEICEDIEELAEAIESGEEITVKSVESTNHL